ncbi:homoserine dehydrogenase [Alloiococcus sp. CFN-8]|uniref:homoserine dehydrogenase n=1 Tax=Alloiococcus sp. CFN-8 TaxID=3416081 RepID=UPI003CF3CAFF
MDNVKIAILGLGNVGQGVWNILSTNKNVINKRAGCNIHIEKILVKNKLKNRTIALPEGVLTEDPEDIFRNDDIKVVIELLGGEQPALDYMLRAMRAKKHVITANKLVLALHGRTLFETAFKEGVHFYYEASVGGGIPIIRELNESLTANKIESLAGIINGTTNYILTKMSKDSMTFQSALKEAQEMGFAEADPTSDVDGYDAAYKLAIISTLSFGQFIDVNSISTEGIAKIHPIDIEYAKKFGYVIKLLAIGKKREGTLELRVHPAMIPDSHPLANVNDSFNAIFLKGNAVGDLMLYGRGAGDLPTGSAVIGDLISVLRNHVAYTFLNLKNENRRPKAILPREKNTSKYYIRLNTLDKPGILGRVATILGSYGISIFTVNQTIINEKNVDVVFTTHLGEEGLVHRALEEIELLNEINSIESIIKIEEL